MSNLITDSNRCDKCGRYPLPDQPSIETKHSLIVNLIMKRIYAREQDRSFTKLECRKLLELFEWRSCWSGQNHDLTIRRIDHKKPLTFENAVVVTVVENFRGPLPVSVVKKATSLHILHQKLLLAQQDKSNGITPKKRKSFEELLGSPSQEVSFFNNDETNQHSSNHEVTPASPSNSESPPAKHQKTAQSGEDSEPEYY